MCIRDRVRGRVRGSFPPNVIASAPLPKGERKKGKRERKEEERERKERERGDTTQETSPKTPYYKL